MITEQKLQPQDFWIPREYPQKYLSASHALKVREKHQKNMTISATPCFYTTFHAPK